jgi:hypothetical protein
VKRAPVAVLTKVAAWLQRSSPDAAEAITLAIAEIERHRAAPAISPDVAREALIWARDLGHLDPPVAIEERSKARTRDTIAYLTAITDRSATP